LIPFFNQIDALRWKQKRLDVLNRWPTLSSIFPDWKIKGPQSHEKEDKRKRSFTNITQKFSQNDNKTSVLLVFENVTGLLTASRLFQGYEEICLKSRWCPAYKIAWKSTWLHPIMVSCRRRKSDNNYWSKRERDLFDFPVDSICLITTWHVKEGFIVLICLRWQPGQNNPNIEIQGAFHPNT